MQGGSSRGVALTAYVAISLLENSDNTNVSEFYIYFIKQCYTQRDSWYRTLSYVLSYLSHLPTNNVEHNYF